MYNWKYNTWAAQVCDPTMNGYIGNKISPEDIEIFSTILLPETIEYKNYTLSIPYGESEAETKSKCDKILIEFGPERVEKIMNLSILTFLFFYTCEKTADTTFSNILLLIKHNWEHLLLKRYPDRKFLILLSDYPLTENEYEPSITFFQI